VLQFFSGGLPMSVRSDGADLWVPDTNANLVYRVRASDRRLLETWTGAQQATSVLVLPGRVFVAGTDPKSGLGRLYAIPADTAPGNVEIVSDFHGNPLIITLNPVGIAFDGRLVWTASKNGTISLIDLTQAGAGPSAKNIAFGNQPSGILFDGQGIWVTDAGIDELFELEPDGTIFQTVHMGKAPKKPVFDGSNIWVPNSGDNSVRVVKASTGSILATLTSGIQNPLAVAFDGQRIAVLNGTLPPTVQLYRAADLSPGIRSSLDQLEDATDICSDGINFWIVGQTVASSHDPAMVKF
jgi:hypothetical protein